MLHRHTTLVAPTLLRAFTSGYGLPLQVTGTAAADVPNALAWRDFVLLQRAIVSKMYVPLHSMR